jgi:hypothetical protein
MRCVDGRTMSFMIAKLVLAGAIAAAAVGLVQAPTADAVCGSIGGRHVDVSGCSDPLYELNDALQPPPPPPPAAAAARCGATATSAAATTAGVRSAGTERERVRQRRAAGQRQRLHLIY